MKNNNQIQAELNEISPELAGVLPPKHNIASHPSGYFETFPEQMLIKVKEAAVVDLPKPSPIIRVLKTSAVAAGLIGMLFTAAKLFIEEESLPVDVPQELAKISNAELEAYMLSEEKSDALAEEVQEKLKQLDINEISAYSINNSLEN